MRRGGEGLRKVAGSPPEAPRHNGMKVSGDSLPLGQRASAEEQVFIGSSLHERVFIENMVTDRKLLAALWLQS